MAELPGIVFTIDLDTGDSAEKLESFVADTSSKASRLARSGKAATEAFDDLDKAIDKAASGSDSATDGLTDVASAAETVEKSISATSGATDTFAESMLAFNQKADAATADMVGQFSVEVPKAVEAATEKFKDFGEGFNRYGVKIAKMGGIHEDLHDQVTKLVDGYYYLEDGITKYAQQTRAAADASEDYSSAVDTVSTSVDSMSDSVVDSSGVWEELVKAHEDSIASLRAWNPFAKNAEVATNALTVTTKAMSGAVETATGETEGMADTFLRFVGELASGKSQISDVTSALGGVSKIAQGGSVNIGKLSKSVAGLVKKMGPLIPILVGMLIAATVIGLFIRLVKWIKASATEAIKAEQSLAALEGRLRSYNQIGEDTTSTIDQMSSSLAFQTSVQFEQINTIQAILTEYGVMRDQQAALTVSATNLARGTQSSFNAAAKAIGEAAQGNAAKLRDMGVAITDIEARAGGAALIIERVNAAFGDRARASILSYGGAMTRAGVAWSNLRREIAKFLSRSPGVIAAINAVSIVIQAVSDALSDIDTDVFRSVGLVAIRVARTIVILIDIVKRFDKALSTVGIGFRAKIKNLQAGFDLLGIGLKSMYGNSEAAARGLLAMTGGANDLVTELDILEASLLSAGGKLKSFGEDGVKNDPTKGGASSIRQSLGFGLDELNDARQRTDELAFAWANFQKDVKSSGASAAERTALLFGGLEKVQAAGRALVELGLDEEFVKWKLGIDDLGTVLDPLAQKFAEITKRNLGLREATEDVLVGFKAFATQSVANFADDPKAAAKALGEGFDAALESLRSLGEGPQVDSAIAALTKLASTFGLVKVALDDGAFSWSEWTTKMEIAQAKMIEQDAAALLSTDRFRLLNDVVQASVGNFIDLASAGELSAKSLAKAVFDQLKATLKAMAIEHAIKGVAALAAASMAAGRYDPFAAASFKNAAKGHFKTAALAGAGAIAAGSIGNALGGGGGGGGAQGGTSNAGTVQARPDPERQTLQINLNIEGQGYVQDLDAFGRDVGRAIAEQYQRVGA